MRKRFLVAGVIAWALAGCGDTTTSSPSGTLDVSVTTTGTENDPDGFAILVDDLQREVLPAAGWAAITGLEPGTHTVELSGIAPYCEVTTDNPLTVEIEAGASTSLTFAVRCSPAAPTGAIRLAISTTGTSLDLNGYGVWVDGKLTGPAAILDTVVVTGLVGGDHSVELRDIASACAATGGPTVTAAVTPPDTTTVSISVVCTTPPPSPATIRVSVTTQVILVPPPSEYTVTLDGRQSKTILPNGTVSFETVAGTHSVRLRGPSYCYVGGFTGAPNPQIVTVAAGARVTVRFAVLCIP